MKKNKENTQQEERSKNKKKKKQLQQKKKKTHYQDRMGNLLSSTGERTNIAFVDEQWYAVRISFQIRILAHAGSPFRRAFAVWAIMQNTALFLKPVFNFFQPTFAVGPRCNDQLSFPNPTTITHPSGENMWHMAIATETMSSGRHVFGWRILNRGTERRAFVPSLERESLH